MLPQNGQQLRPQQSQPSLSSFLPQSTGFENTPYFNLDPSQAAKQMAALNAASQARIAQSRASGPPISLGGTSSGPFLGGINPTNPTATHDNLSGSIGAQSGFPMSNNNVMSPAVNPTIPSLGDSSMSQSNVILRNPTQPIQQHPQMVAATAKQRQQQFLTGLANVMAKRNTPLPPTLTGVYAPNYDPNSTMWKMIEPSPTEIGSFRLAGKDVDLFRLWGTVLQNGGGSVLQANNGWTSLLPLFDLPEEFMQPNGASVPVAMLLMQHYFSILHPFEEIYKKNMQEQQKRAQMMSRQAGQVQPGLIPPNPNRPGQGPQGQTQVPNIAPQRGPLGNIINPAVQAGIAGHAHNALNTSQPQASHTPQPVHTPTVPTNDASHVTPGTTSRAGSVPGTEHPNQVGSQAQIDATSVDQDPQRIKRKLDQEEDENKRARQKMGADAPEAQSISSGPNRALPSLPPNGQSSALSRQPRRKMEYVPLRRELDTYGGRNLKLIEAEHNALAQRRPLRDINDWGTIDIDSLTFSIRSRLSSELSYALTTFTLLSTMRGQQPGTGFPIQQCPDLLDEVLDLVQEQAFGSANNEPDAITADEDYPSIFTNRELVSIVSEKEASPFASLEKPRSQQLKATGPVQPPSSLILVVFNIVRNLSIIESNSEYLAKHERILDVFLRVTAIVTTQDGKPQPLSPALSLADVIVLRKNVLQTFVGLGGLMQFPSTPSHSALRIVRRLFRLLASYLVDPSDSLPPSSCTSPPYTGNPKPPVLPDMALDALTKLTQADSNRQVLAKVIPQEQLQQLFNALVHRLPVLDADFQLGFREPWLSYLEKDVMAIYSIAFLAPPDLKQRIIADRKLGIKAVMFKLVQRCLRLSNTENRGWFVVCARRAIEAMKVLDDGGDQFDAPKAVMAPTLSFGMGFGEPGDTGSEKGTGILGGHRDLALELLLLPVLNTDEVMFGELDSLVRIE